MFGSPKIGNSMNASGLVVRTWNDAPICRRDSDGYADATAMCQANGKLWADYQRLQRTQEYLKALEGVMGNPITGEQAQLIQMTQGGAAHLQGTWIHPRLAVDLARWLNPAFAVWMDGWFLEQLEQAQPSPALQGDHWRSMDVDTWFAQPVTLRAAQYLLLNAEDGGSYALDLIRERDSRRTGPSLACATGHRIQSLYDLPPSGRGVVLTVRNLRASGGPARGIDVRRELSGFWSPDTIANQLTRLRQLGLVTKRGTGWHLTQRAIGLAEEHDREQGSAEAA
jgi:hypothetical protein